MRIGIDVREFECDKMTGIGRYLLNFLVWVTKEKQETEFFLYGNQHTKFPVQAQNLIERVIPGKVTFYWDQILLPLHLKRDKIDIFFSPYYKAPIFSPCPACITIHDLLFLELSNNQPKEKIKNFLFLFLARLICNKAFKIITVSFYSKKNIIRHIKVRKEKVEVVYNNSADFLFPEPDPKELKRVRQKYNTGDKYILYVGNFKRHKNVKNLLSAFQLLQKDNLYKEYKLILGGVRDADSVSIEKIVAELNIEHKIIFTGLLDDKDMRPLYSNALLFVFPSFYEGFGLPIIEAMSCGTAVVCSNRSSMPEISGDAAYLVDPENVNEISRAMTEVLSNKKIRTSLIKKGLEKAKEINETKFAERVYDILISSPSGVNDLKNSN